MGITRRRFLQSAAVLGGAAVAAGITGCGPVAAPAAAPQSRTRVTFRVNWKFTGPHAAYLLGIERGFYRDAGLEVDLQEGSGSVAVAQLVGNKSTMFGLVDAAAAIPLIVKELPLKCVGMVAPRTSLGVIARKDSGVQTLKDLEGKTLAVTPGDSLTQIWPAVVAANNLDASKIRVVNVDAAAKVPAVLEKRADALLGSVADQNFILQGEGVETVDLAFPDFGVNVLNLGIFVHVDTLENEPETIRAFLKATQQSLLAAEKEGEAAVDLLVKATPELEREVAENQFKAHSTQWRSPNCPDVPYLYNCPGDWQETFDIMVNYLDLETTMKPEDFYTNEFLPAA